VGAILVEYHINTGGGGPCGVLNTRATPEGGFLVVAQYRGGGVIPVGGSDTKKQDK